MKRHFIKSNVMPIVLVVLVSFGYGCINTKERFERGYVSDMEPLEDVYDPTKTVTISGQVFDLDSLEYEEEIGIVNLNVAGTDGKHYYVQVAPNWFLEAKGVSFQEGELITVTGSLTDLTDVYEEEEEEEEEEDLQGENPISYVIVAREIKKRARVLKVRDKKGNPLWYRQGMLIGRKRYIKKYLEEQKDKILNKNLGGPITQDPRQTIYPRSAPLYP